VSVCILVEKRGKKNKYGHQEEEEEEEVQKKK